jgi:hypothetical protein
MVTLVAMLFSGYLDVAGCDAAALAGFLSLAVGGWPASAAG